MTRRDLTPKQIRRRNRAGLIADLGERDQRQRVQALWTRAELAISEALGEEPLDFGEVMSRASARRP